ncbi:MAG: HAMP domain-containing sensor histidine kinase [Candidatus Parcubacteria bacterium]|nr:HAMP domain-containing sensor histidine kinase [Candidatus Parcubacteria bacterium]
MNFKETIEELNVSAFCRKYNLSLWQCPQFLFIIMGIIVIISSLSFYFIGNRYVEDPLEVAFLVLLISLGLLIIGTIITKSFEKVAEASRLKSEFINIVSHQLRAPLSNLQWTLELIMSGRVGTIEKKQTEYFLILKENSARMQELVGNLLIVARIEGQKLLFKNEFFPLKQAVNDLIKEFEPYATASNVKVIIEAPDDLPQVYGDSYQIKLAVENLLDNAVRYIKDQGEVKISIKKEKDYVYVEVSDNGVGIPENDKKYIFQKFFRSENALKNKTQGSGLGLYIVKSIIVKSLGQIGFFSEEGKGTTFWFTLPINKFKK